MAAKKAIYSILDLKGNVIQNVGTPSLDTDVATKASAQAQADAAKSGAEATAQTYATTAKTEAIAAAALDATSKATTAKTEAIAAAATDATTKANAAVTTANGYTDTKIAALIGEDTPAALDTLKEISDALADQDDAVAALVTSIGNVASDLATETTNRENADTALDGRLDTAEGDIDTLQGDISSINTSLANKLQIATGTANGAGTETAEGFEYTINHGLNKANVIVQVYDGNDVVDVVIRKVDNNNVKLITGSALGATTLSVVVAG